MSIPKKARKITINGERWGWRTDGWNVDIWEPNGTRHRVNAGSEFDQHNKGCACCGWYGFRAGKAIEPGMIRKYIEENLMEQVPEFVPEEPEVGKLFVYRPDKVSQGPSIVINSLKGGDSKDRYARLYDYCNQKQPFFLVGYRISATDEKVSYAKFLVADLMVEFVIRYPQTFRGSFEYYDTWREIQESTV